MTDATALRLFVLRTKSVYPYITLSPCLIFHPSIHPSIQRLSSEFGATEENFVDWTYDSTQDCRQVPSRRKNNFAKWRTVPDEELKLLLLSRDVFKACRGKVSKIFNQKGNF